MVQEGTVGMGYLVECVLNEKLDKSAPVRLSKWSKKDLSPQQMDYAALDVLKPLEVYYKISTLPDLNTRLGPAAALPETEVDVVPKHGYAPDMATRGAVGTITKYSTFVSPDGFTPALLKANAGKSRIVKVTKVYSPFLLVPGMKKNGKAACLGDFGEPPFNIIATFGMLKLHVESEHVRSFPRPVDAQVPPRVTPPAPPRASTPSATNPPTINILTNNPAMNLLPTSRAWNLPMNPSTKQEMNQEDDTFFDATENGEMFTNSDGEDDENDEATREMETGDIDLIEAARVLAEAATSGNSNILPAFICKHLDKPPESTIEDVFSSVLGDAFHQMKRPYVPIKHEYKKPYFVALMRAWFCWNEKKLKHVKDILKANDWTEDDIKKKMYYHPRFFQERVEQRILPPSKLY